MQKTSGSSTGTKAYGKLFNHPALSLCHHQFSKLFVYIPHHNPAIKKDPTVCPPKLFTWTAVIPYYM